MFYHCRKDDEGKVTDARFDAGTYRWMYDVTEKGQFRTISII